MGKKNKNAQIIFIVAIMFAMLFMATGCVGTLVVNYALDRDSVKTTDLESTIFGTDESELTESQKLERGNSIILREHTLEFMERVKPEKLAVMSEDGLNLIGNFYRNDGSHLYAIVVHGYGSRKEDMLIFGSYFYDWGFNVLAPDCRSHGESDGKWIGMGLPDSSDILVWVKNIVCRDPDAKIVLHGVSMGGAAVMMAGGLDLPDNVKCIVEDCGYSSTYDEFADQLDLKFGLKPEPILTWADNASQRIAGYSIKEASSVERLAYAKVPMLFIHGTSDEYVPYWMLNKNIEAYKGPYIQVLRVDGAGHARSVARDPSDYLGTVRDFVLKFCNEENSLSGQVL